MGESITAEFNWLDVPPSKAVVETVAIAADREPMALKPLYDTIDPDTLDILIRLWETSSADGMTSVTFALDGPEVTVQRDGMIVFRPVEAPTEPE